MAFYVNFEAGEDGIDTGDEGGDSDVSMEFALSSRLPSSSNRGSSRSAKDRHLKRVNTIFSSSSSESESDDTTPDKPPKDTTERSKDATERPKDGVARTERRKQRTPLQKLALHPSQQFGGCSETFTAELKKTNVILTSLVKRVKSTESRMKVIEEKIAGASTPSSSGSLSTPKRSRARDIPPEVRRETRRVYRMLVEEDAENFSGWKIEPGTTYKDPQNQTVMFHPLPWLSSNVDLFKRELDEAILKEKSPQSRRQMKERVQGSPSSHPPPHSGAFPSWVLMILTEHYLGYAL